MIIPSKSTTRRRLAWVWLTLAALAVTACGFHLRGAAQLPAPMARTYVAGIGEHSELARQLRPELGANGVEVVSRPEEAGAHLVVMRDDMQRQVLSVGERARVREFQLRYRVAFRVRAPDGTVLIPEQSLELVRDFTFDQRQVLAKTGEEAILREDLFRDMARLMLTRIEAVGTAPG